MREGFLIDDLVEIPEKYKHMTIEELQEEIKANIITIRNIIRYKYKKKSFSKKFKTFYERVKPYVKDEAEKNQLFHGKVTYCNILSSILLC